MNNPEGEGFSFPQRQGQHTKTHHPYMNTPKRFKTQAATALLAALGITTSFAGENWKKEQAALLSQAKISREQATQTALAKVGGGTLKEEGEIEREKGSIVWSFDITTPGSKDITEVMVDAVTGDVVSVEKENPKAQKEEAAADAKEGK